MSGIIGVTVGTPTSPAKMKEEINPVLMVNGTKPDATGNVNVSGGGGGGDPLLESRVQTLEGQVAQLLYSPITITSFSHSSGTREMGETVNNVTFNWTTNKTPTSLTLNGNSIEPELKSKTLTGLGLTSTSSFDLIAYDEKGNNKKTTTINFYNGVYYGVGYIPHVDSDFIKELSKDLRANKKPEFTVDAGSNQYIYYCLPVRMGKCSFTVGGFTGGFSLIDTIPFTNPIGYEEEYYIYRSDNTGLGETTVYVE